MSLRSSIVGAATRLKAASPQAATGASRFAGLRLPTRLFGRKRTSISIPNHLRLVFMLKEALETLSASKQTRATRGAQGWQGTRLEKQLVLSASDGAAGWLRAPGRVPNQSDESGIRPDAAQLHHVSR